VVDPQGRAQWALGRDRAPEGFAEEFYAQFAEVFAKQSLRPPYALGRVRAMIARCHASGDLLLARVRGPDGQSIATGIYLGYGRTLLFWGNGSRREHQKLRPNEALHWFAMRYWKAPGVQLHDWAGRRLQGQVRLHDPRHADAAQTAL
jgi:hypothetical protein